MQKHFAQFHISQQLSFVNAEQVFHAFQFEYSFR